MDTDETQIRETRKRVIQNLRELGSDFEAAHGEAEELVLEMLAAVGEREVVREYRRAKKKFKFAYA